MRGHPAEAEVPDQAGVTASAARGHRLPGAADDLPHYHGVAIGNETSSRKATGA